MHRFALFVDGSNLFGSLRTMSLRVDDYESFFQYIFDQAVLRWSETIRGIQPQAQLFRVYWYEVGTMDQWDLADVKAQAHLRDRFEGDREIRRTYMALAGQKLKGASQDKIAAEAWAMCYAECKSWYEYKSGILEGMRRFHHAIRNGTDFIDVIECGHWKVDLLHRSLEEKGLDTTLAVDMVAMERNYDVAVILSGDSDHIPSINYMKERAKHVAAVEFLSGYPPEKRGRSFSSHLKLAADFVVQIYEMELVKEGLAKKESAPAAAALPQAIKALPAQ